MKNTHNLNNHTIEELVAALKVYLTENRFVLQVYRSDEKNYTIVGKTQEDIHKTLGCTIYLTANDDNTVSVKIRKGNWGEKILGASWVLIVLTNPVLRLPVTLATCAACSVNIGNSTVKQMSLPQKIDSYIDGYLHAGQMSAIEN